MLSNVYSKQKIKEAEEVVVYAEKRKKLLKELADEMQHDLKQFFEHKVIYDKKNRTTTLIHLVMGKKLEQTVVRCSTSDHFSELIGKYICIKKALHKNFSKAMEAIEPNEHCLLCKPNDYNIFKRVLDNGFKTDRYDSATQVMQDLTGGLYHKAVDRERTEAILSNGERVTIYYNRRK